MAIMGHQSLFFVGKILCDLGCFQPFPEPKFYRFESVQAAYV